MTEPLSADLAGTLARVLHPEYNSMPLADAVVAVDKLLAERDRYRATLARVRQYCELTADSCHVPTRQTARDVLQLLDEPAAAGEWR